ncbi:MAG: peptidoglycan editing factor PgeF [Rhodobacteraceae bacterium]|nr:MAG: peptidoglycan editing factor PgeF [Paracoccaceae bacterium]
MSGALELLSSPLLAEVPHAFFTRRGGVSRGVHAGLNCGPGSADDPAAVAENRARAAAALGAKTLATLHQVHSATALALETAPEAPRPQADAAATATPGLAVGALSADCAPILFADVAAGVVAAAHAGWRGALGGVIEATVALMVEMGATRARVVAAVGPCISQRAYEVGPEFVEAFLDEDPAFARFFAGGRDDRALFDLPGFCLDRLRDAGVERCEWIGRCTHADPDRFYSHRRGRQAGAADYGRLLSAVRLPDRRPR